VWLSGRRSIDLEGDALGDDGQPLDPGREPIAAVLATGQPARDCVVGVCRSGKPERIWLLVNAEPRSSDDGRIAEIVCGFYDISSQSREVGA
jgi:hypothetical protein